MKLFMAVTITALVCGCQTYRQLPPDQQQALLRKASNTCAQFGYAPKTRAFTKCVQHALLRYDQGVIDRWN
ncbi:MAG: hypothetical protein ABJN26_08330 [Stappiaceae bacterium]